MLVLYKNVINQHIYLFYLKLTFYIFKWFEIILYTKNTLKMPNL
jgi:hypothetical protein